MEGQIGEDQVPLRVDTRLGEEQLRVGVAVGPVLRQLGGPHHEPAAQRMCDGTGADADEPDRCTRNPCREAPDEDVERYSERSAAEIIEDARSGNDHHVEAPQTGDGAHQVRHQFEDGTQPPQSRANVAGGRLHCDRLDAEPLLHPLGTIAEADEPCVGAYPANKADHGLERTVIAEIAAAEQAEKADPPTLSGDDRTDRHLPNGPTLHS